MIAFLWIGTAIFAYLISGLNPAILLSRAVYKQDVREVGSKNAGFTNFKRSFGGKLAWAVFALDLLKGALISTAAGLLFLHFYGDFPLGAAYAGVFAMLGHAYPIYYSFKGGKGFLVCLSTLFFLDYRAGLIAFALLTVLLLTVHIMSVSTMAALIGGTVALALFGGSLPVVLIYCGCVLFMILRHRENIKRLFHGTESKFYLKSRK